VSFTITITITTTIAIQHTIPYTCHYHPVDVAAAEHRLLGVVVEVNSKAVAVRSLAVAVRSLAVVGHKAVDHKAVDHRAAAGIAVHRLEVVVCSTLVGVALGSLCFVDPFILYFYFLLL
jgi:hypothetical protein